MKFNSSFTFKNQNFNFIAQIHKIIIKTNLKVPNKIFIIKRNKETNKENIKMFYRKFNCYDLIILLLIASIFSLSYQNSLSYITLKVSRAGKQKIFCNSSSFTRPNEVWKDNYMINLLDNHYYLNSTNIIKFIWTNDITGCKYMFKGCNTITEINFTKFDATKCDSTISMFKGCTSLKSLDLSGFITSSQLKQMSDMFFECKSIISLNLSSFNTSEVTSFGHMFYNCESLKWIDFPNVKTEKIIYLDNMFNGCKELTSINLSNIATSNLNHISYMFEGCESLKIIDFPNLDITNVGEENLKNVFLNCKNLEYN